MTDFGRDELIDAKRDRQKLIDGIATMGKAVEKLMDDRVRHMTALSQIADMSNSGTTIVNRDVFAVAKDALAAEAGREADRG